MTELAAIALGALIAVAFACGCWTLLQIAAVATGRSVPRFWSDADDELGPARRDAVRAWSGLAPEAPGPVADAACCIHVWESGESEGHCLECLAIEDEQERARAVRVDPAAGRAAARAEYDANVRPLVLDRAHRPNSAA